MLHTILNLKKALYYKALSNQFKMVQDVSSILYKSKNTNSIFHVFVFFIYRNNIHLELDLEPRNCYFFPFRVILKIGGG